MMKYLLLLSFFFSSVESRELEINEDHSKISFEVDYMSLTSVQGIFKKYFGTFNFSAREIEISDINVSVLATSIDTSDPKRDTHLRGHEFFFISNYPEMTFVAKGPFLVQKDKTFKVNGELSMRGFKRPIVLNGIYKGSMIDPWKKENYFFELTTSINRQDFGMTWNKELDSGGYILGDEVRIKLAIQAQPSGDKTAFSTHMVPSTKAIIERDHLKKGKIKKLSTSTDPKERASESGKKN